MCDLGRQYRLGLLKDDLEWKLKLHELSKQEHFLANIEGGYIVLSYLASNIF